jgi:FkbM family methyltransferase
MMKLAKALARIPLRVGTAALRGLGRARGLAYAPPNYLYFPTFNSDSIVFDVGCCDKPDFSMPLLRQYGLRVWAVDPTRRHAAALSAISRESGGLFRHLPVAVSGRSGTLVFHESADNDSGSLLAEHRNILRDVTTDYEVHSVLPSELLQLANVRSADFLKLDLEGAEYDLLASCSRGEFDRFQQILIEFHHGIVSRYSVIDTWQAVRRVRSFGMKCFSLNGRDWLFYRSTRTDS